MQIEKINENKLEVIINIEDLIKNNISIHSFMSESIENQSLFLEILNFANKKIGFNLENCEIKVEAFSLPARDSFILIITRIPTNCVFHLSKTIQKKFKYNKSYLFKFKNFENLCVFFNLIPKDLKAISSLYLLNNSYFVYFKFTHLKDLIKVMLIGSEFSDCIHNNKFLIDENAQLIIKDSAIQTCQKYFV